jgi:hypothetical protein
MSHARDIAPEAFDDTGPPIPTLGELLAADPDRFVARYTDIAAVNLACATGLAGAEDLDIPACLRLLDEMAAAVRSRVEAGQRIFRLKPAEFHHSQAVFRVLTMQHALRVGFGIRYNPAFEHLRPEQGDLGAWTRDSGDVFIHGVLSPRRLGTCSSLPTFAIAVGRRVGSPLKLVRVPNHTFFRWDAGVGGERFNVEHTPAGSTIRPDDYYYTWPIPWDGGMRALNAECRVWLHSLTPRQEVSKFLCNRAIQLRDEGRPREALEAIETAGRFEPTNPACDDIEFEILQQMPVSVSTSPVLKALVPGIGPVSQAVGLGREPSEVTEPVRDGTGAPEWLHSQIICSADGRAPLSTSPTTISLNPRKEC